jgi:hypothetical protein
VARNALLQTAVQATPVVARLRRRRARLLGPESFGKFTFALATLLGAALDPGCTPSWCARSPAPGPTPPILGGAATPAGPSWCRPALFAARRSPKPVDTTLAAWLLGATLVLQSGIAGRHRLHC